MIKLGSIDIVTKVSLLSSHVSLPREGHSDAAVHVVAQVDPWYNSRQVYDPLYPEIDHSVFKKCDWSEFYMDDKEAIPMNTPEPWGKEVDIYMLEDNNHAEDQVSCWSICGFLIYFNTTLVQLFSKKQSTVDTLVFGAEFVAMNQGIDELRGLGISLGWLVYQYPVFYVLMETTCQLYIIYPDQNQL